MKIVVVDTNVWVSALLNPRGFPAQVKDSWIRGKFEVALSVPLVAEISDVLRRPSIKGKYDLSEEDISEFIELLLRRSALVGITGQLKLCRDVRDNMLLETAIAAGARLIVSRDDDVKRDLRVMEEMRAQDVEIVTVSQFLGRLTPQNLTE